MEDENKDDLPAPSRPRFPGVVVMPAPAPRADAVMLESEKAHVAALREQDPAVARWNPQGHMVGLALSGGGIRSATFGLGVLQAIAERGWLRRFDYLSTVSGGGYIGSWLSALLHRKGSEPGVTDRTGEVEKLISPRNISNKSDEPIEIAFLRAYSNYLTPRLGVFSADTLAAVVGYVRNLTFNLLLTLLTISLVLVLIHGPLAWVVIHVSQWRDGRFLTELMQGVFAMAAPFCALLLTVQSLDIRSAAASPQGSSMTLSILHLAQKWYGQAVLYASVPLLMLVGVLLDTRLPETPSLLTVVMIGLGALLLFLGGAFLAYLMVGLTRDYEDESDTIEKAAEYSIERFVTQVLKAGWRMYLDGRKEGWRYLTAGVVCVLVAYGLLRAASGLGGVPAVYAMFRGPALAVAGFGVLLIVWLGIVGTTYTDQTREWLSRLLGAIVGVLAIWGLLGLLVLHARPLWQWAANATGFVGQHTVSSGFLLAAALVVAAWLLALSKTGPAARKTLSQWVLTLVCMAVVVVVWAACTVVFQTTLMGLGGVGAEVSNAAGYGVYFNQHLTALSEAVALIHWPAIPAWPGSWTTVPVWLKDGVWACAQAWPGAALLVAVSAAAYLAFRYVDVNAFSLQNLYRNRLVRCYLGAAHGQQRLAEPFAGFDPRDDIPMSALATQRPYPIVNAALNLTQGNDLAWQQRKAASFSFSPRDCGFWLESAAQSGLAGSEPLRGGFAPTSAYAHEPVNWPSPHEGVLLGTAMATSGAAVSSQMGFASRSLFAFVLTLFNVRLGRWFPNPARQNEPALQKERSPRFAAWWFLRELMGHTDERSRWVYLSDGGHFENLGIYELVRRRCRYIVAVDAGADPSMSFGDLGNAVRKCRVDFGVDIRIDLTGLLPTTPGERPESSSAVGKVDYPPSGGQRGFTGEILYIKLSLPTGIGLLPVDVLAFAKEQPAFPHQPTSDQWFTETQFESYRQLGYVIGKDALKKGKEMFGSIGATPPV